MDQPQQPKGIYENHLVTMQAYTLALQHSNIPHDFAIRRAACEQIIASVEDISSAITYLASIQRMGRKIFSVRFLNDILEPDVSRNDDLYTGQ